MTNIYPVQIAELLFIFFLFYETFLADRIIIFPSIVRIFWRIFENKKRKK